MDDLQYSEDKKSNNRKICCNQLNIFPIYTVAFTVSEIYDKTVISEDSDNLEYPIDNETVSSTTLKNKGSVEVTKSNINQEIDTEGSPAIPVNHAMNITERPAISVSNAIDITLRPEIPGNNAIHITEKPAIPVKDVIDITERPAILVNHAIDITERLAISGNNTEDNRERPVIPINNAIDITGRPAILVKDAIDITERRAIPVKDAIDITERPAIPVNHLIDITDILAIPGNNTEDIKERPVIPINNAIDITGRPAIPVNHLIDITDILAIPGNNTEDIRERPVIPINNAIDITGRPAISVKDAIDITERRAIPVKDAIDITERPAIPVNHLIDITDILAIPSNNTEVIRERPVIPINNAIDITERYAIPVSNAIDIKLKPAIPVKDAIDSTERRAIPVKDAIDITERPAISVNHSIDITDILAIPGNNTEDIRERPVIPINNTIDITERPAIPGNNAIHITERPAIPVKDAIDITERPAISVNHAIDITDRLAIPSNNTKDIRERPVIPINNAIDYSVNTEHENNNNNPRSECLPSTIKYIKKPLKSQRTVFAALKSKPKKCRRLVKIKNTYFKNKNVENNINKKLETYYDRANNKCTNVGNFHRKINSDSILNAVPLTRILKKVLAKENLLDDIDKISLNGNHNEDKISYVSESSQHTLTRGRSISSDNSDFNNTKTAPSVIDVSNYMQIKNISSADTNRDNKLISSNTSIEIDQTEHPYKTDIIAVAVARIENASILNYKKKPCDTNSPENFIIKESLTSAESYLSQTVTESSTSFEMLHSIGKEDHLATIDINNSGVSSQTLTETQKVLNLTSESDNFVIAKTSSYFRDDHVDSNITLTPVICLKNESDKQQSKLSPPKLLKSKLLDTILNVGMYPKITTSIHDNFYSSELKDVLITEEIRNSLPLKRLDNDCSNENKYSTGIFKKSYAEDDSNRQKSINLPNEETIKELLFNRDQAQKKSCSEEFRNYTPFSELLDKLTLFLDKAIKKLEDAITEKITQEMNKTLERLDKYINSSIGNSKFSRSETFLKKESREANILSTMEAGESKCLQCHSIQNNVLDELVKKMNLVGLKTFKSPPLRLKEKFNINDDFFEVLKPTLVTHVSNEKRNVESIVAPSSEGVEVKYSKLQNLPLFMLNIVRFVKENLVVIASVPLFCVALFLIYTFLVMLASI